MDASVVSITAAALRQALQSDPPPLVLDVRRQERFLDSEYLIQGALRRDPSAGGSLDAKPAAFSHESERCSFDALLRHHRLESDPALALIVRGADTHRRELAPQAAGLAAVSIGLSRNFPDDHEMLGHGMVIYDALYAWCSEGKSEAHTWNPAAYK